MANRILLVDDDADLRELLSTYLTRHGIEVATLGHARSLARRLEQDRPDALVLDITLPGIDGLAVLRALRAQGDDLPVLLLSGLSEEVDRIVGLELGADDYLGKPFNPRELLARIDAVLRRRAGPPSIARGRPRTLQIGRFTLDPGTRMLRTGERALMLSASEFALLNVFVSHAMRTLTRERLNDLLYGSARAHTDRGVDVQVWRLRRILEVDPSAPRLIQTVRGRGYVFVPTGAPQDGVPA
jgi:two-component system phosphate regulon response regulator OmpR